MSVARYSVTQYPISTMLEAVRAGEIAIPEIQRPFVWSATKVRNLLDSLLQGFPIGYLIAWKNPDVKLKDGSTSSGKRILIDGQQRVTALMAALQGREVINKDYATIGIRIAYHPIERRFEVHNPAIALDKAWLPDVSVMFRSETSVFQIVTDYCAKNPDATQDDVYKGIESLKSITGNHLGMIELDSSLDIETVTEIFIRVNSEGVPLSQADFAMSKIAVNETYGGNELRKAIDYFCHLAVAPHFHDIIQKNDKTFAAGPYFHKMSWLKNEVDEIYDPSYTDMLRVAFTSQFRRGRLEDLVALLSGRNFETKQFEESIVENSFSRMREGVLRFMNETSFKNFVMIVLSAGFADPSMIRSQNALNFAYILYLLLKEQKTPPADIESYVRKWLVFSLLTRRYSGSPESKIDLDVRQIDSVGFDEYASVTFRGEISDSFWDTVLPQALDTSVASSPLFRLFAAAQSFLGDKGFLSKDISVHDLVAVKSDVHHVFPKAFLKRNGYDRRLYNQIANFAITQSEINIAISNKEPRVYFGELLEQCEGGKKRYGNIVTKADLRENLASHCIPDGVESFGVDEYRDFLNARRVLMAQKMKRYFDSL